ncbi:uncharacterized protein FA14DRAFT_181338 [Meira miltonrushii]|uniref:Uncharacterized protein n=1 Tax=Meira miltonrushii TaxID=1280837 RepID=A0A316V515_9BASI|nr:uncharacterized protein FA14DRAFT_181338 [Meira miltonrushii]PWN32657.1 hypothetical protein FA14DRAFT_181338 [Meira miltonrushii]
MRAFLERLFKSHSDKETGPPSQKDKDIQQIRQRFQDQIQEGVRFQGKEKYEIQIAKSEGEHVRDLMAKAYSQYGGIVMLDAGITSETILSGGNGLQALLKRHQICRGLDVYLEDSVGVVVRLNEQEERNLIRQRATAKGYTFSMTISYLGQREKA